MVISKYLNTVEGTEKEAKLISGMLKLSEEEGVAQLMDKPVVGKIFTALDVLGKSESIAEFKQTEHYDNIKDFSIIEFDLEKGFFSIHPGPKHLKKMLAVAAVVGAGILLWKLRRKCKTKSIIEAN